MEVFCPTILYNIASIHCDLQVLVNAQLSQHFNQVKV